MPTTGRCGGACGFPSTNDTPPIIRVLMSRGTSSSNGSHMEEDGGRREAV